MLSIQKNANLNAYVGGTLNHVLTSQFLLFNINSLLRLKRVSFQIQTKKHKKIHYLYLWLLTGQKPHSAKFNVSLKNTSPNNLVKTKAKRQRVQVSLLKRHYSRCLNEVLWEIISKQTHAEKKVWTFQQLDVQLKISAVPLTSKTLVLQALNSYFPNIPLGLRFRFSYSTAFEKIFFLRALKFLASESKLKGLDLFEEDDV